MTTTTSSSKRNRLGILIRHDLGRIKFMTMLYTIMGFLTLPLQYILQVKKLLAESMGQELLWEHYFFGTNAQIYMGSMLPFFLITPIFVLIIGSQLLQYNFNKRAVDVYYAMPFTRRQMMLSYLISGTAAISLPVLINYAIVGVVNAMYVQLPIFQGLLYDALLWCFVLVFIFFSMAFVSNYMGTGLDTILFTLGINCTPAFMALTLTITASNFLVGFNPSSDFIRLLNQLHPIAIAASEISSEQAGNGIALLIWLGIAIVLAVASVLLFERREAELAENVGRDNWLKLVEKMVGMYLGANLFALFLFSSTRNYSYFYISPKDCLSYNLYALIGAALTFVIIEVILGRGFKNIRRNLWICGCGIAFTMLLLIPINTGLAGYEKRIPAISDVQSIRIDQRVLEHSSILTDDLLDQQKGLLITEPEGIAVVINTHRCITESIDQLKNDMEASEKLGIQHTNFEVEYQMKNGTTMSRSYYGISTAANEQLSRLFSQEEVIRQTSSILLLDSNQLQTIELIGSDGTNYGRPQNLSNGKLLLEAVQKDLFGTLSNTEARTETPIYFLNLQFQRYADAEKMASRPTYEYNYSMQVPILPSHTDTLKVIEQVYPHAEAMHLDAKQIKTVAIGYPSRGIIDPDGQAGRSLSKSKLIENFYYDLELSGLTTEQIQWLLDAGQSYTAPLDENTLGLCFILQTPPEEPQTAISLYLPIRQCPDWFKQAINDSAKALDMPYLSFENQVENGANA